MTADGWIGLTAFVAGIIGTVIAAIYAARKNTAAAKANTEIEDALVQELRLARQDREILEEFLRLGRRLSEAIEAMPVAIADHARALRYLAMKQE